MVDALVALGDADVVALSDAICRVVHIDEQDVASAVAHLETRPTPTMLAVAAALARSAEPSDAIDNLLTNLLRQAKQRIDDAEPDAPLANALVAYAARIATELTRADVTADRVKMLGAWADAVVDMAVRIPAANNVATETSEDGATDVSWVVQLAGAFFRVHQHSPVQSDFRIMTLVWKNLNKLSAVHRSALLEHGGRETTTHVETAYSFQAAFEAAGTCLARTTQRLRAAGKGYPDQDIAFDLKMLRLFLRAFQGHFVQFVDGMVAQVECSVALAVDAVAAVVPTAECLVTQSEKTQHEAIRVLQCVISFIETMGTSDKMQASTRSFVGTLLWQSSDKMVTLIKQTRSQYIDADDCVVHTSDTLLQWGHLLALAAFYAVHGDVDESVLAAGTVAPDFAGIAGLFARFRAWSDRVLIGEFPKTSSVFVDIVLDSLVARASTTSALQTFLLEQTLHPNPGQRFLLWDLWRELMCFIWEDAVVSTAFDALFQLTHAKTSNGAVLEVQVRDDILSLLAYVYAEVCARVKREYLSIVASTFDVVCAEGPNHKLTPKLASSFDLLEILANSSLLVEYDEPNKEDWIAHYLPVAMECIGGIHDLLDQDQTMTSAQRCGVLRVLDAGLLIVRSIFEDNDASDVQNAQGLGGMLLPMCAETITHLAKMVQGDQGSSSPVSTRSFTRVLRNCLELLTTLAPLLKANRTNQCVQIIKDLLTIVQFDHELTPHATAIVNFFRDALGDLWVMPSDADVVWKMLGCVFHKLSALNFGLQVDPAVQSLTTPQSVCLEAIYSVLERSNLPEFASRQRNIKSWVVSHAQPRFAKYIQMMCEGIQVAESSKRLHCERWCRSPHYDELFARRIPAAREQDEENSTRKREREHASTRVEADAPSRIVSGDDIDMDEEIENAKRVKWDSFATTYWQLHDSLSSLTTPNLQEAFLDRLTEKDLDSATSALQTLLNKNQTT